MQRLDGNLARLGVLFASGLGLKKKGGGSWELDDIIRWGHRPDANSDREVSIEEFFAAMGGKRNK